MNHSKRSDFWPRPMRSSECSSGYAFCAPKGGSNQSQASVRNRQLTVRSSGPSLCGDEVSGFGVGLDSVFGAAEVGSVGLATATSSCAQQEPAKNSANTGNTLRVSFVQIIVGFPFCIKSARMRSYSATSGDGARKSFWYEKIPARSIEAWCHLRRHCAPSCSNAAAARKNAAAQRYKPQEYWPVRSLIEIGRAHV